MVMVFPSGRILNVTPWLAPGSLPASDLPPPRSSGTGRGDPRGPRFARQAGPAARTGAAASRAAVHCQSDDRVDREHLPRASRRGLVGIIHQTSWYGCNRLPGNHFGANHPQALCDCHPERSEGSGWILRCAQNDKVSGRIIRVRIGREITSRFRKGTVPFSLRENRDSPQVYRELLDPG